MSTVHVLVGQCGNQLGASFLDALASQAEASRDEEYQMRVSAAHFRPPLRYTDDSTGARHMLFDRLAPKSRMPQPRCVMVDMEPKVIEEAIKRVNGDDRIGAHYCLAPQQCVTRGEGSGNNWAFGYYSQGESRREEIGECLRRESEGADSSASISTYHVVHSVAGGTGSGVGCLVAETVREFYPHAALLHSIVWPFSGGEVATQWYNTVLSVSHLCDTADAICVAYNDTIANRLLGQKGVASKGGAARALEESVTFDEMNENISRLWAPLHLPHKIYPTPTPVKDKSRARIQQESVTAEVRTKEAEAAPPLKGLRYTAAEDVIEAVSLDPLRKLFTGVAVPGATLRQLRPAAAPAVSTWPAVLGEAARVSREVLGPADGTMGVSSRCGLWMMRGQGAVGEGVRALQHMLTESACVLGTLCVSSDPASSGRGHVRVDGDMSPLHEVTMYGHAAVIPESIEAALIRTEKQLEAGAYTYQFERYGADKEALRDCTMKLWDVVNAYS